MPRPVLLPLLALALVACAPAVQPVVDLARVAGVAEAQTTPTPQAARVAPSEGVASWYGPGFAGRLTANGETFDPSQLTAAHKTLPFDARVRVTNLANGKSVVVRINDRGPFKPGRMLDLSRAAAERIGMVGSGTARVRVELIPVPSGAVVAAGFDGLDGYDVLSAQHRAGQLLLLSSRQAPDPVVARVVGGAFPVGTGATLLLPPDLFARLGESVTVTLE